MDLSFVTEPFRTAPRSQQVALGVLGLALIAAGSWFLLLAPVQERVAAAEVRLAALEREVAEGRMALAALGRLRRQRDTLAAQIAGLRERLPSARETPGLYRAIADAAAGTGLAVALFQPKDPKARDYVAEIPIALSAEGRYHQVGTFLAKVSGLPRIVNVEELKLAALADEKGPRRGATLRLDLTLVTYMYRAEGARAPQRAASGTPPAAPEPAASPTSSAPPAPPASPPGMPDSPPGPVLKGF